MTPSDDSWAKLKRKRIWLFAWLSISRRILLVSGCLAVIGIVDAVHPLNAPFRSLITICTFIIAAGITYISVKHLQQIPISDDRFAREVETANPALESVLINAVQFRTSILAAPAVTANLMQIEISHADAAVSRIGFHSLLQHYVIKKALLHSFLSLTFIVITLFLFPKLLQFEFPRLFTPWRSQPAYSRTDFTVTPGNIEIKYGSDLEIQVRCTGAAARTIDIVTEEPGSQPTSLPMSFNSYGSFTASLKDLRQSCAYKIVSDTGESQQYQIKVNQNSHANSPRQSAQSHSKEKVRAKSSSLTDARNHGSRGSEDGSQKPRTSTTQLKKMRNPTERRQKTDSRDIKAVIPDGSAKKGNVSVEEGYPLEYRPLVHDYFKSINEGR